MPRVVVQAFTICCTSARVTDPTALDPITGMTWLLRMLRSRSTEERRLVASDSSQVSATLWMGIDALRGSIQVPRFRSVLSESSKACASRLVGKVREYSSPSGSRKRTS